jgi:peptidoglycan/LPS O-acetylase OafA/YrhL
MFGLILGIPLIIFVRDVEKNYSKKWKNLDGLLGFLSYGIFLQHFNMMWFLNWSGSERTWIVLVAVFLGTYVLAFIGHYFLEKNMRK